MMRKGRRSQMEIFGIAIVVVIMVIAFFFYIGTKLKKPVSVSEGFIDVEVSQRFVDAILNSRTECRAPVSDIIRDCAGTRKDLCAPRNSCDYAEETIKNALDSTLSVWKKSYRFTVKQGGNDLIPPISSAKPCTDDMEKEAPGIQPVPAMPIITVQLEICKG
jgi:hypothetical protein